MIARKLSGGLAQLARAPALQAGGRRFDSDILHQGTRTSGQNERSSFQDIGGVQRQQPRGGLRSSPMRRNKPVL